jgi:hypothetical protein
MEMDSEIYQTKHLQPKEKLTNFNYHRYETLIKIGS